MRVGKLLCYNHRIIRKKHSVLYWLVLFNLTILFFSTSFEDSFAVDPIIHFENAMLGTILPEYLFSHEMDIKIELDPTGPLPSTINVDITSLFGGDSGLENLVFNQIGNSNFYQLDPPVTYINFTKVYSSNVAGPTLKTQEIDEVIVQVDGYSNIKKAKVIKDAYGIFPVFNINRQPDLTAEPDCNSGKDVDGLCNEWQVETGSEQGLIITHNTVTYKYLCDSNDPDNPSNLCPKKGAKDIYLEIDALKGHAPDANAIQNVINSFLKQGIRLHVQVDEEIPFHDLTISGPSDLNQGNTQFDKLKKAYFGNSTDRTGSDELVKNKLTAKRFAFHYAIFAHNISNPLGASGLAEYPGNDFVVSLGNWAGGVGSPDDQAGTLMHELGHNLGLHHGGGDSVNCKPNYLSVMSWSRQLSGFFLEPRPLDYSRESISSSRESIPNLGFLNKGDLDETKGILVNRYQSPQPTVYFDSSGNPHVVNSSGFWPSQKNLLWTSFEGTLADSSGNQNDGSPASGTSAAYEDLPQTPGSSYKFNIDVTTGQNNHIIIPNEELFDFELDQPFSISFWVKKPIDSNNVFLVSKKLGLDASPGFLIWRWGGGSGVIVYLYDGLGNKYQVYGGNINDNTPHHIAFTYDGLGDQNGMKLYIDGNDPIVGLPLPFSTDPSATLQNDQPVVIGNFKDGFYPLSGWMDEVQIWNHELSKGEVRLLNNQHQPRGVQIINEINWDGDSDIEISVNYPYINQIVVPNVIDCSETATILDGYNDWDNLKIDMFNPAWATQSILDGLGETPPFDILLIIIIILIIGLIILAIFLAREIQQYRKVAS